jgi:hypothetical protein
MQMAQGALLPICFVKLVTVILQLSCIYPEQVNRGYTVKQTSSHPVEKRFISYVANWMYFFTSSVETESEELHCKDLLMKFVHESMVTKNPKRKISAKLGNETLAFLEKSFWPVLRKLCFRHYMYIPSGDVASNCATESENASLKKSVCGPKNYHKLAVAAHATCQHVRQRMQQLRQKADRRIESSQDEYAGECLKTGVERSLETLLVPRICSMAGEQYELSENFRYTTYPFLSAGEPKNATKVVDGSQTFLVRDMFLPSHKDKANPIPLYSRTRYVSQ